MKKLLITLALCLLAAPSFAAPDGWVEGVASKDVNAAVAADPSAIHRGGALIVDHATLQQQLLPWDDGDSITLDFVLPGALSGCAPTPVGWECDVDGSTWRAGVADLDGVKGLGKLSTAMDDFTAPGAQSYVRIPIGEVVDHGGNEWRPVEKQLGGDWQDFTFAVQPALTEQEILDGSIQGAWVPGSIAIYHKTKAHDINSATGPPRYYMTGKAAHMPAPVAVGFRSNLTTITGWCYGWFEFDEVTGRIEKVFPYDVVAGWSAQTASVVVDATLGYTTIGATSFGFVEQANFYLGTPPENATIDSFSVHSGATAWQNGSGSFAAAYTDGGTAPSIPSALIANSQSDDNTTITAETWIDYTVSGTANIAISDELWMSVYAQSDSVWRMYYRYDAVGGEKIVYNGNYGFITTAPDPWDAGGSAQSNFRGSAYLTYTAAASAPITTNAALTDTTPDKGDSPTLSATITDGDNPTTAAEWFVSPPADPGEGSGASATLLGGSSPFTISESVATAGLDSGAYTISVRGFDATDGWGAVDTVGMTVTLAAPTSPAAVGGDETVTVSWDAVTGATSYNIYWGLATGITTGSTKITGVTSPYVHTGRTNGVEYFYKMEAVDAGGVSPLSAEVSAEAGAAASTDNGPMGLGLGLEL